MDPVSAMALNVTKWLVATMIDTLKSNLSDAWTVRKKLGGDVSGLNDELLQVKALLHSAEGRATSNSAFEEILQQLRDAAEDANNLLDELDYFRLRDKVKGKQDAADAVDESSFQRALHATGDALKLTTRNLFSQRKRTLHDVKFNRVEMSRRLKDAVEVLQRHRTAAHNILLTLPPAPPKSLSLRIPTTHFQPHSEPLVVGRDEVRDELVGKLISPEQLGDSAPVLTVLPIVGQGGLGKTTLARYVYNDQRLGRDIFQLKIWLCVSQGAFDVVRLTQKMLEHIPKAKSEDGLNANSTDLEHLQNIIVKRINDSTTRFLLVLDDMWECTRQKWDHLITPLCHAQARGNVIIVTTRRQDIAKMVETKGFNLLELTGLETKFLWRYFKFCIFNDDCSDFDDFKMKEIAEKIFLRLKGNPLAARTIGRLLGRHVDINHWKEVMEKPMWRHGEEANDILSILKLSYEYLDFPVNRCFLYCGLFPDDYEFDAVELLRFWIGHGYIDPAGQVETNKLLGHEYLNTLVDHGIFERKVVEGCTTYVLHDFLHELARDISSSECLILDDLMTTKSIPKTVRHVSILTKGIYQYDEDGMVKRNESFEKVLLDLKRKLEIEKLYTLMLVGRCDLHLLSTLESVFQEATGLRVLFILVRSVIEIGNSFSSLFLKLLHLRFLKLEVGGYHWSYKIPDSLSTCYHLKVLETNTKNASLSTDVCNLVMLSHFVAAEDLHSSIGNVGRLEHLQELKKFQVGRSEAFRLSQLGKMNKLGGSLAICSLQNTKTIDDAREARLEEKRIEKLSLSWDMPTNSELLLWNEDFQIEMVECLRPNKNVRELSIDSYIGQTIPKWLGESQYCDRLESICLRNCLQWKELPPFDTLYSLKHLEIKGLRLVTKLEFGALDKGPLEVLVVHDMQELVSIEINKLYFSSLRKVSIVNCPKLLEVNFTNSPSVEDEKFEWFFNLESLDIEKCEQLQISVPPLPHTSKIRKWNVKNVQSMPYSHSICGDDHLEWSGVEGLMIIDNSLINFHYLRWLKVLTISDCPDLKMWSGFNQLQSLEVLIFEKCCLREVPKQPGWLLPSTIEIFSLDKCEITGEGVSVLLRQLPKLSKLILKWCHGIESVVMGDWTASNINDTHQICAIAEESSCVDRIKTNTSLQELSIQHCENAVLDGGTTAEIVLSLKRLASLKSLAIYDCPIFYHKCEGIMPDFPSKLESLVLSGVHPMLHKLVDEFNGAPQLQELKLSYCSFSTAAMEGLMVHSLQHLTSLCVVKCEGFVAWWKLASTRGLKMPLQSLEIDDAGFLTAPIRSQISSTLRYLTFCYAHQLEVFSVEQEEALLLLSSLRQLRFWDCRNLRSLPQQLHRLATLKNLQLYGCHELKSLPPSGLPSTLQFLDVLFCAESLHVQCKKLKGIPELRIHEPTGIGGIEQS